MTRDPVDPVCGMHVDEETAAAKTDYKGETYYFCAVGCKERFEENPDKFVSALEDEEKDEES